MTGPRGWLARPCGRVAIAALGLFVCAAPAWLFFDPFGPSARDPVGVYRLHSDDWAYLAASRTWPRALGNLFVPHNTHVVPTWRVLTWALAAASGRIAALPGVLAVASYAVLVAVMLLAGRLVARETGRAGAGWSAAAAVGTTSLMLWPATWYSAGQTLWAALGILATLWFLQGWRRDGGGARLVSAALAAVAAGGFWTIGHMAGPLGAVYLWADGRPRCRKAAAVPLAATVLAVAVGLGLGARRIDSTVSFHGRTTREAIDPVMGASHTAQSIPEDLVLGNLGLSGATTPAQGAALTAGLVAVWVGSHRQGKGKGRRFGPLELAGAGLVAGSYLVEWTVRGYLPYSSLRGVVPWYDAIPHVGLVLFVAGWWAGAPGPEAPPKTPPLSRAGALGVVGLVVGLVVLNRPRADAQWVERDNPADPSAGRQSGPAPAPAVVSARSAWLSRSRAGWQRRSLADLDRAEAVARSLGFDRASIRRAFGRVDAPELVKAYDAADLLDLPRRATPADPDRVRAALGRLLTKAPEPAPPWAPGVNRTPRRTRSPP